jgi:hypothetical protein
MAAGVTGRLWEMVDIVDVLDVRYPKLREHLGAAVITGPCSAS